MRFSKAILTIIALASSGTANAAIVIYTDPATLAGQTSAVIENFDDTTLATGLSFTSNAGSIGGGLFNDRLVAGQAETTFTFAGGADSFGGIFDLSPGGFGQGIEFVLGLSGGGTETAGRIRTESGFFGFTSTNRFNSVTLRGYDTVNGSAETYNLNNAQFGVFSAVPEPGTWAMMLFGIGGVGFAMRRRTGKVNARARLSL